MSVPLDWLYSLLPALYRRRDAIQGEPLRALLGVMQDEMSAVRDDIDALYENWFVETCDDWVVPYIGALVGAGQLSASQAGASLRRRARSRRVKSSTLFFSSLALRRASRFSPSPSRLPNMRS